MTRLTISYPGDPPMAAEIWTWGEWRQAHPQPRIIQFGWPGKMKTIDVGEEGGCDGCNADIGPSDRGVHLPDVNQFQCWRCFTKYWLPYVTDPASSPPAA